jgi:hypothetical protein
MVRPGDNGTPGEEENIRDSVSELAEQEDEGFLGGDTEHLQEGQQEQEDGQMSQASSDLLQRFIRNASQNIARDPDTANMGDHTAIVATLHSLLEQQAKTQKRQQEHERRQREYDLAILKLIQDIQKSSTQAATEKRTFVALPHLTSEAELEDWDSQLRSSLAPYRLARYIDEDVPEPADKNSTAWSIWDADRADVYRLITASLRRGGVWSRMTRIGWKPEDVDPRATYQKVFEALQHGTVNTTRLLIKEWMELKPPKFDTMDAYINRLCIIRRRLRNMGIKNPLEMDVYPVLTAIKADYPELFDRNIRKMEDKSPTWETLIRDMTETCVDKDMKKTFVNINVDKKKGKDDTSSANNDSQKEKTGGRPKRDKKCPDCPATFYRPVVHCKCGNHHTPKGTFWACNPEDAPDAWPRKAEFLEKKRTKETATSSTAPLHQNSGVSNPHNSPARISNMLYTTNFASLRPSFSLRPAEPSTMPNAEVRQACKAIRDLVYYDSAAADTVFNDLKWFTELHPMAKPRTYLSSSGNFTEASQMGVVAYKTKLSTGQEVTVEISEALYNPQSPVNLVCTAKLVDEGIRWNQDDNTLYRKDTGQVITEMERVGDVFIINAQPTTLGGQVARADNPTAAILASINYRTMHRRLMHASKAVVEAACKSAGIDLTGKDDNKFCEPCVMGKATDELGKCAPVQGTKPFHFVRVDIVTHKIPGHLGYKYSIHIIDMWSGFHWVKYAREKKDVFERLKDWLIMIHNNTGEWVKILGIDGGTEFGQSPKEFQDGKLAVWTDARGITVWKTPKHSPWMNGRIERAASIIVEKTRTTMIAYKIPDHL